MAMKKLVIIINGTGGVGKDTICNIVSKYYSVKNVSSIDPIKKIAKLGGWNGIKDDKSRKLLADLKKMFTVYNDLPLRYLCKQYNDFLKDNNDILFVHIREPLEIDRFKSSVTTSICTTLLITGKKSIVHGNEPDDNVENYHYDYIYPNIKSLDELETDFIEFFNNTFIKKVFDE